MFFLVVGPLWNSWDCSWHRLCMLLLLKLLPKRFRSSDLAGWTQNSDPDGEGLKNVSKDE